MNVVTKSVEATIQPVESEHPNGEFELLLSTEDIDRDDENLWIEEWKQPLPKRIQIDGDHSRSIEKTVGSVVPRIEGTELRGKGPFAPTDYAQTVRQILNDPGAEGHGIGCSVTYRETKDKSGNPQRELLNAALVAVPANPKAIVLSSKSADKADGGMSASGDNPDVKHDDMVQAIHDAACHLGAQCANEIEADPGTADGANKSANTETSSTKDAGLPQESPDSDPAKAATKAAALPSAPAEVPAKAADLTADDTALAKAKELEKGRALAFLISMNTKD